jgi:hypothetical protein
LNSCGCEGLPWYGGVLVSVSCLLRSRSAIASTQRAQIDCIVSCYLPCLRAQISDQDTTVHTGADCPSTARHSHQSLKSPRTCTHRRNNPNAMSTALGLSSGNDQIATSQTTRQHILQHRCHERHMQVTPEAQYRKVIHSTNRNRRIECI